MKKKFDLSDVLPIYGVYVTLDLANYFNFLRIAVGGIKKYLSLINEFEKRHEIFLNALKNEKMSFYEITDNFKYVISESKNNTVVYYALRLAVGKSLVDKHQILSPVNQIEFIDDKSFSEYLHNIIKYYGFYFNPIIIEGKKLETQISYYYNEVYQDVSDHYDMIMSEEDETVIEQETAIN